MTNKVLVAKLTVYQDFKHKGSHIVIKESSIARGYQFKALVNGMSLGCNINEQEARNEAIRFADKVYENAKKD